DLRAQGSRLANHPNLIIREGREEPIDFPVLPRQTRVQFSSEEADKYLWYGWSGREIYSRWTDSGKAALAFSVDEQVRKQRGVKLRIFGNPYLAPGKVDSQRVTIELNGQKIAEWTLNSTEPTVHVIEAPGSAFTDRNPLVFRLPDAASPRAL